MLQLQLLMLGQQQLQLQSRLSHIGPPRRTGSKSIGASE
jgi:hypothetical protein